MRFSIDYDPSDGALIVDVACRTRSQRELGAFIRATQAIRDHIAREKATQVREARQKPKPVEAVKSENAA